MGYAASVPGWAEMQFNQLKRRELKLWGPPISQRERTIVVVSGGLWPSSATSVPISLFGPDGSQF